MAKANPSKEKETEDTRQAILQAAQRLFFEYGYRAVTTRQVAEACGLTQPALYHHFANKQDLYMAMIIDELQHMQSIMERVVRRNDSVEERLRLLVPCLIGNMSHDMALMFHDLSTELESSNRAKVEQTFNDCVINPIKSVFEDGLQQGQLRNFAEGGLPSELAAWMFLNLVGNFFGEHRVFVEKLLGRNETEIARLLVRLSLHGLAKTLPPPAD